LYRFSPSGYERAWADASANKFVCVSPLGHAAAVAGAVAARARSVERSTPAKFAVHGYEGGADTGW
jgi:hypothetical protein